MKDINHPTTEPTSFIIFIVLFSPSLFFMFYFGYFVLILMLTFIGEYVFWNILNHLKLSFKKAYLTLSGYALLVTLLVLFLSYIITHGYIAPASMYAKTTETMMMSIIANLFSVYLILIQWLYLAFVCHLFKMRQYVFVSILGGVMGVLLVEAIFLL